MRDLRAELREWHEGTPVEWQPVEGDILVGFVREDPPIDWVAAIPESVVVSEERTGTPVTVSLASPQLSALFELHNPRGNDRIGIKCTGRGGFVMMMDRETESRERLLRQAQDERSDSAPEEDECVGATSEERAYIEQMLLGETSTAGPDDCPVAQGPKIAGVIQREEKAIARQTRGLEILESVLSPSALHGGQVTDPPQVTPEAKPRRKRRWIRATLIVIALVAACVIGVAYSLGYRGSDLVDWLHSLPPQ